MADIVSNPIVGNVLSVVAVGGTIVSYATLSRRIKRLEKLIAANGLGTVALSSAGAISDPASVGMDPNRIDLLARIEQLEAQNELLIKKINSHEMFLAHVGHELKARVAGNHQQLAAGQYQQPGQTQHAHYASPLTQIASSPTDRRQRILTPSVSLGEPKHRQEYSESESDETDSEEESAVSASESEESGSDVDAAREFLMSKPK